MFKADKNEGSRWQFGSVKKYEINNDADDGEQHQRADTEHQNCVYSTCYTGTATKR